MRMNPDSQDQSGGGGGGFDLMRVLPFRNGNIPPDMYPSVPPVILPPASSGGYQLTVTPAQGAASNLNVNQNTNPVVTPAASSVATTPTAATAAASSATSVLPSWLTAPLPASILNALPTSIATPLASVPTWAYLGLGALLFFGNKGKQGRY